MLITNIQDLKPETIQAKIVVRCIANHEHGFQIADTTGSAFLYPTEQQQISLNIDHWYCIENIRSKMVNGFVRLCSDPWSVEILEPGDPAVDQIVQKRPNISLVEYVQVFKAEATPIT